jgi:hypothetical protein
VYLNGVKLIDGVDFTAGDGNTITLTEPAIDGDVVVVIAYGTFNVANSVPSTGGTFQGPVHFADSVSFLEGSLGSAAFLNTGSSIGDLVAFDSDGSGNASLNTPNITDSDGVTVQTTYVTNGSAKAWFLFDQTVPLLRDSLNVSSMDDDGAGDWGCNFTTAFADTDYAISGSILARTVTTSGRGGIHVGYDYISAVKTTSGFDGATAASASDVSGAVQQDTQQTVSSVFGDLA